MGIFTDSELQLRSYDTGVLGFDTNLVKPSAFEVTPEMQNIINRGLSAAQLGSQSLGSKLSFGTNFLTVAPGDDIQKAINTMRDSGGGSVYMAAGTYYINNDLVIYSGVNLEGSNSSATVIDFGNQPYSIKATGTDAYTTGTISVAINSVVVKGLGTAWTNDMVGQNISLEGIFGYVIVSVESPTSLTIDTNFVSTSGNGNLIGDQYAIATVVASGGVNNLTIQNSTAPAILLQYTEFFVSEGVFIDSCQYGLKADFSGTINKSNGGCTNCEYGYYLNHCDGFSFFSDYVYSTTVGDGMNITNSGDATLFNISFSSCAGNGITFIGGYNTAIVSYAVNDNTGHGVEFVSGTNDIELDGAVIGNNGGDGIKITATSSTNQFLAHSIRNNVGYGFNIAASSCSENIIIGNNFGANGSGAINDAGTDTVIGVNSGDGSSVLTVKYGTDSGSNDAYAISTQPVTRAYSIGQKFIFRANTANTGAATLNVDGLGAVTIKKKSATDLANNDILAGQLVEVGYNAADTPNTTLDSYSEANKDDHWTVKGSGGSVQATSQTFGVGATTAIITSAKFYLAKNGSPTGNIIVQVYAVTGSPGTTGKPTGDALATSNNLDISTLSTSFALATFTFTGNDQITLTASASYCIVIRYTGGDASNYLKVGRDGSAPSHTGNSAYTTDGVTWISDTPDNPFYVIATTLATPRFEMLSPISN